MAVFDEVKNFDDSSQLCSMSAPLLSRGVGLIHLNGNTLTRDVILGNTTTATATNTIFANNNNNNDSTRTANHQSQLDGIEPQVVKRHVGVFWDIQNCAISQPNQVSNVVQNIRELYRDLNAIEGEFAVVCDVYGVNKHVLGTLNNLQADVFHVCSFSKNACDEKLKQLIYRFVSLYGKNAVIILISSDINFAPICSDLKYRQQVHVILVHSTHVSPSLIVAASESRSFEDFKNTTENVTSTENKQADFSAEIIVTISCWPYEYSLSDAETLLTRLTQNVGGKVVWVNSRKRYGIVLFKSHNDAQRCVQHVHNRILRYTTLKAKILNPQEGIKFEETEEHNFETDLIQLIEKTDKLEIPVADLHQQLLEVYPQRYHFNLQEFKTFLAAYNLKRIVLRHEPKNDIVRLEKFFHDTAVAIRVLKIFNSKKNPCLIEEIYSEYCTTYHLDSSLGNTSPKHVWNQFKNILWLFARFNIADGIVLIHSDGRSYMAKFNSQAWSIEIAKIFSILRSRVMSFQEFYHEYTQSFTTYLAAGVFWNKNLHGLIKILKDEQGLFSIQIQPVYEFADRCLEIMFSHFDEPTCTFEDLIQFYSNHFEIEIPSPLEYGFNDLTSLFKSLSIFDIHGDVIKFNFVQFFSATGGNRCVDCDKKRESFEEMETFTDETVMFESFDSDDHHDLYDD